MEGRGHRPQRRAARQRLTRMGRRPACRQPAVSSLTGLGGGARRHRRGARLRRRRGAGRPRRRPLLRARRLHRRGRRPRRRARRRSRPRTPPSSPPSPSSADCPARAASIALATAYQESKILNIEHGDRDSVGLFQQRPSQGWGTGRADPGPGLLDQRVLRRAGRGRRLRGRWRSPWPRRRCSAPPSPTPTPTTRPTPVPSPRRSPATARRRSGARRPATPTRRATASTTPGSSRRAATVREELESVFGAALPRRLRAGRRLLGPHGGLGALRGPGDRHLRAADQRGQPASAAGRSRHYLVAQADRLSINTIIFDDRIWRAGSRCERRLDRLRRAVLVRRRPRDPRAPRPRARRRRRLSRTHPVRQRSGPTVRCASRADPARPHGGTRPIGRRHEGHDMASFSSTLYTIGTALSRAQDAEVAVEPPRRPGSGSTATSAPSTATASSCTCDDGGSRDRSAWRASTSVLACGQADEFEGRPQQVEAGSGATCRRHADDEDGAEPIA